MLCKHIQISTQIQQRNSQTHLWLLVACSIWVTSPGWDMLHTWHGLYYKTYNHSWIHLSHITFSLGPWLISQAYIHADEFKSKFNNPIPITLSPFLAWTIIYQGITIPFSFQPILVNFWSWLQAIWDDSKRSVDSAFSISVKQLMAKKWPETVHL